MINIVFTVFSLAILVVAMVSKNNTDTTKPVDTSVLSATVDQTESPLPTATQSASPSATPVPTAAASATATASPKPATTPDTGFLSKADWIYPHNSDLTQTDTTIAFKATDDPKTIVNWYSDKIKAYGFNSRGVIQAKSNEKVHNSVSGGNSKGNVSVDITQENSSAPVKVEVTISSNSSGNSSVNISI